MPARALLLTLLSIVASATLDAQTQNTHGEKKISTSFDQPSNSTTTESPRVLEKNTDPPWECPNITKDGVECSCDFPHTLRCTGDSAALQVISEHLKGTREGGISLLDVTVTGISTLPARFLQGVSLHGLVVSTGELRRVNENAFASLSRPLQALGLPNNLLDSVPAPALSHLGGLDRLDLSRNKLKTLEAYSFKGLGSLTYLDLCDNLLSQLSPQAFSPLKALRSLKMRGNRLSVSALSALRGLKNLEELDLASNLLIGPLGPNLLPPMPKLKFLTASENELVNVQQGALMGLRNLSSLSLSHNQIDVLEDHSFKHLGSLTQLDLASNRIVAVSSASLAHLDNLITLDLTHNFLRSLTADLVVPLTSLQDLRLDDNDITMVSNEVPTSKLKLKHLSLSDNPLNCDCTLLDFANWLANSSLGSEDKESAVCATPPALENGILTQVSPGSLLCGEPTPPMMTKVPLAGAQLSLEEFHYDLKGVHLVWKVEPCPEVYTCDTLIIYEDIDDSEVEIESIPLDCDSKIMRDPCRLPVNIPSSTSLQKGHKYRYCVVLIVPTPVDDLSLGLGCSDVIPLEEDRFKWATGLAEQKSLLPSTEPALPQDRITGVHVNVSDQGFLHVDVSLSSSDAQSQLCELTVVVFTGDSAPLHRKRLNCSVTFATMAGLVPGRYKVCASLDNVEALEEFEKGLDQAQARCVEVQAFRQNFELIILAVAVATCALFLLFFLVIRSIVKKFKHPRTQNQCFLPAQEFEITHKAHYIKLLATTKV